MKDLEIAAVGNHRDRQAFIGPGTDAFNDTGRKANAHVGRAVTEKLQERHAAKNEWVAHPKRAGELRPKVPHFKDERLSAEPFGGKARDDGRDRRRGRKDQIAVERKREADGTKGEAKERPTPAEQRIVIRVGERQRNDVDAVHFAAIPAPGGIMGQIKPAELVRTTYHCHLMPARDQCPRKLIGTRAG